MDFDPNTGALIQGAQRGIKVTVPRRPLWHRIGIKLGLYNPRKVAAKKWGKRVSEEYSSKSVFKKFAQSDIGMIE